MTEAPTTAAPRVHYADDAVTLWAGDCLDVLRGLEADSVDAVVTDPPYGLANTTGPLVAETIGRWLAGDREFMPTGQGFMGRRWDAFVPPVAVWDECYRVLKPGGHLLAFAGSRTLDLMTLGVRLAGFDVRDTIAWLYGSGFPKSLDVSDAVARRAAGETYDPAERAIRPGVYDVTRFLREARDKAGWTNRRIDALFGTTGMAGHWTTQASQPAVPSVRQWAVLKEHLGFGDELDDLVAELAATERPEDWGQGEGSDGPFLGALKKDADYEPAGDWGTALKPAIEPVVVARKALAGTVAANILTYGTGALNIGGCRTPHASAADLAESQAKNQHARWGSASGASSTYGDYSATEARDYDGTAGRWPTNVVLDEHAAAELNRQTAATPDAGAARMFPRFKYAPKAPTAERPRVGDVTHPTVKPLELMRWLVRLVTPPGGTVLEPFAGSGTTAEACVVEGFRCVAIEREPDYLPLIVQRLTKPIQQGLDVDLFG